VTVRMRGVMEKCSYCLQRINAARIDAQTSGRELRDGDIVTACEGACPTQAIVFGDLNIEDSQVAQAQASGRSYQLLHALGTRPRTTYRVRLSNPKPGPDRGLEPRSDSGTEGQQT
jgi:Fe-S-cluster-containing dehydrogenase component